MAGTNDVVFKILEKNYLSDMKAIFVIHLDRRKRN